MKTMLVATILVIGSLTLAGCSASESRSDLTPTAAHSTTQSSDERLAAITRYAQLERNTIPQILETSRGMYSKVEIIGNENGITYIYTYTENHTGVAPQLELEKSQPLLVAVSKERIFPALRLLGVTDPVNAAFAYMNPNGNQVWATVIESDD